MERLQVDPDDGSVTAGARVVVATLARLPQGALSRVAGRLADLPIPRMLRRPVLGTVARLLGIDTAEAELDVAQYRTVDELFTRRLRPGVRTIAADPAVMVSPVDGILGEAGTVRDGRLLQVKGRSYSLAGLLDDGAAAARYDGGVYVTIYLSPSHYHRIHSPCDGVVRSARRVPGALMPVNPPALLLTPDLFPRNERLVCHVDGAAGRTAVVAVGAFNVGRISAAFDAAWNRPTGGVTNRRGATAETREYDPPVPVRKGEEVMAFHLGSTVVLVLEPGRGELASGLASGDEVRLGQAIARVITSSRLPGRRKPQQPEAI
jgi:phosphatidylserine decarboxylase